MSERLTDDRLVELAVTASQARSGSDVEIGADDLSALAAEVREYRARQAAGVTGAMVEAGARALWARRWSTTWDSYSVGRVPASDRVNDLRAHEMRAARTALMAALGIDAEGETDEA